MLSLVEVLRCRARVRPGEVVTIVGQLAGVLADAHGRGLAHGAVDADAVTLAADGRPLLAGPFTRGGDAGADVRALAAIGLRALLGDPPAQPRGAAAASLAEVLRDAAAGRVDATTLARRVLAACPAAPVSAAPAPRGRLLRPAVLAAALAAAIVLGTVWGRHAPGGAAVLPAHPGALLSTPQPGTDWTGIVRALETARARAYDRGDVTALRGVYTTSSATGHVDVEHLRRLAVDGRHARGLAAFVIGDVVLLGSTTTRATLRVTDALTAYDVVDETGHVVRRGTGRPARTLMFVLARVGSTWRVDEVRTG